MPLVVFRRTIWTALKVCKYVEVQTFGFSQKLVWERDSNWNFSCLTTGNHWGDDYKMADVKRNAGSKITLPFLSSASLKWPHYFTNHFLSLSTHDNHPSFLLGFPQECNASSSEDKLYKAEKAQQLYVKVCKTGRKGSSGWKVRFISQVRDSCCCLTFAAHLPSIPPFSKPLKAFFSLWSLSFPSPFTFPSVPSYPSYFQGGDWQKWNFFFSRGRMLNMPEWIKKGGENWKRKDVHEILRATAAVLCNARSVTVIVLKCVHVCSCMSVHSRVYFYSVSVCESPHEEMPLYWKSRSQSSGCLPVPVLSRRTLTATDQSVYLSLFYLI